MMKALHGVLMARVLHCNKFRKDIEAEGYQVNPCHVCVANKITSGKQHALTCHVEDAKSSHVDSKANEKFCKWDNQKHGSDELCHIVVTRGKRHEHVGMILDCIKKNHVGVGMTCYQEAMCDEIPEKIKPRGKYHQKDALFKVDDDSLSLSEQKPEIFHTFVMKGMFRGTLVKIWTGNNFQTNEDRKHNKIIAKESALFFSECWIDRCKVLHDEEKQWERLSQWHENAINGMENSEIEEKMHAERTRLGMNRSTSESSRSWTLG